MFDEHENFHWVDKNYFVLIINSFNLIKYSQQAFHKVLSSLQNRHVQDIKTPPPPSSYLGTYYGVQLSFWMGGRKSHNPPPSNNFPLYLLPFSKCFLKNSLMTHTLLYFKPFSLLPPSLIHHPCLPPNILTLSCSLQSLIITYFSWVRTGDVCVLTVWVSQSYCICLCH